jgi:hypothetical protein
LTNSTLDSIAAWPERFVYVCSATRSAIVNIAPVAHAGARRVARAVILCGADKGSSSGVDKREAIDPADRLTTWLKSRQISTEVVRGPPDDPGHWAAALESLLLETEAEGLPLVFNAAGGRTQMKLGALWRPDPRLLVLAVEGNPFRTVLIRTIAGRPRSSVAPRYGNLDFHDLFHCHNALEARPSERLETEAFFKLHAGAIASFGQALIDGRTMRLASKIQGPAASLFSGGQFNPGEFELGSKSLSLEALRRLETLPGLEIREAAGDNTEVSVTDVRTAKTLSGGWLEAMIYNRLRTLADEPRLKVVANLALEDWHAPSPDGSKADWGEIDVGLLIGDQMHFVEAKAAIFAGSPQDDLDKGARRKALDQLNLFRNRLLGQFGGGWIVNPLARPSDISPAYTARVAKVGEIFVGPTAIDRLVRRVEGLIAA